MTSRLGTGKSLFLQCISFTSLVHTPICVKNEHQHNIGVLTQILSRPQRYIQLEVGLDPKDTEN